jgi:hypothetical protein
MFALTRLILIDSYKANAFQELRLNGHTNLNGVNGAGKTTLLRLLPLFFGERPSRLVVKSRVMDSFAKYYLPNDSSYIIFEYQRRQQLCMVVIYAAQNEESLCYRFVDKAFDIAYFTEPRTDDVLMPISCRVLNRHWKFKRLQYSEQLTAYSDYRTVIQNLTTTKPELRQLAARYAFGTGSGGQRLKDMEKIVSGMLTRFTEFSDLREMLVSCIDEDGKVISLGTKPEILSTWHKEYRAFEKVEAERQQATRLMLLNEGLAQTINRLAQLQQRLRLLLQKNQQQAQQQQHDKEQIEQQGNQLEKNWQNQNQTLSSALVRIKAELEQSQREKNNLEKEHAAWQQRDINGQTLLASRLDTIKTRLARETENLREFSTLIQDIDAKFKQLEAELKENFAKQEYGYKLQIGDIERHSLATQSEAKDSFQQQKTELQQSSQTQLDAIQNRTATLNQHLGDINGQLKAVQADPQLLRDKEQKQDQLNKILQDKQVAEQQARDFDKKKQATQASIDALVKAKQQRAEQRQQTQQKLVLLKQQLNAAPDTLLHFLREQQPQWVEDIAKVIQPELLMRDDLEPRLSMNNDSLYGLQLNLNTLAADYTADEVQIRRHISDCEQRLEKLQHLDQQDDIELKELSKIRETLNRQQQHAEATASSYQNHTAKGQQELSSLSQQIERSKKLRRAEFEQQHQTIKEQIAAQEQQLQTTRNALTQQLKELQNQLTAELQAIVQRGQQQIESVQQQINHIIRQQQTELAQLNQQRLRSLQERNIDTVTLQELEKTIEQLRAEQKQADAAVSLVKDHQRWQVQQWTRHPDILEAIRRHETAQQQQKQDYEIAKRDYSSQKQVLQAQYEKINAELKQCLQQQNNIQDLLAKLNDYSLSLNQDVQLESAHTLAFLQRDYWDLVEQYKNQRKNLAQLINRLKRVLAQDVGSRPAQYYQTQENLLGLQADDGAWINVIQSWYSNDLAEYQSWIISQARNFGGDIHSYKQALARFDEGIHKLSRRLRDHIDKTICFEKIERVEARLISTVDKLDYWQPLEQFSELYNEWQRSAGELPNAEFAKVIEQIAQQLQGKGELKTRLVNLLELEIEVTESGRTKTAKQTDDLRHISSNGLSYLILCVIFIALVNMIRKEQPITIIWPMDELKDLHDCNIEPLLAVLAEHNIHVLSAFPSADPNLLVLFSNAYNLVNRELVEFVLGDDDV